jgi:type II secretory pathway component PulM
MNDCRTVTQMTQRLGRIEAQLTRLEARLTRVERRILYGGGALGLLMSLYAWV